MKISLIFIQRWDSGSVFDIELIDKRSGFIVFKASGKNAIKLFKNESGGHRWQRVPPTEKRGRYQTSTITVVVLEPVDKSKVQINPKDLNWKFSRGTGPGGQHKNKTDTAVQLTHLPTKIVVRCDGRSQDGNKNTALEILKAKIKAIRLDKQYQKRNSMRKEQAGSGMRGDKIRTIRVRDNKVIDHRLNKTTAYKKYMRGDLTDLR